MRCIEVIGSLETIQTEADAADAQLQAIKRQEKALKVRKAQAVANKAQQKVITARRAAASSI
jgi:hypothetical protein